MRGLSPQLSISSHSTPTILPDLFFVPQFCTAPLRQMNPPHKNNTVQNKSLGSDLRFDRPSWLIIHEDKCQEHLVSMFWARYKWLSEVETRETNNLQKVICEKTGHVVIRLARFKSGYHCEFNIIAGGIHNISYHHCGTNRTLLSIK